MSSPIASSFPLSGYTDDTVPPFASSITSITSSSAIINPESSVKCSSDIVLPDSMICFSRSDFDRYLLICASILRTVASAVYVAFSFSSFIRFIICKCTAQFIPINITINTSIVLFRILPVYFFLSIAVFSLSCPPEQTL